MIYNNLSFIRTKFNRSQGVNHFLELIPVQRIVLINIFFSHRFLGNKTKRTLLEICFIHK